MHRNDFVSRADLSLAKHAEIKTVAMAGQEALCHIVAVKIQIRLETRNARMGDDHFRSADFESLHRTIGA